MRITPDQAARIKACQGVYTLSDTARHFNVAKDTVHALWTGTRHVDIAPAPEPENVASRRVPREVVLEDAPLLMGRGLNVVQTAQQLGMSKSRLYEILKEEGIEPAYFF